ncbi:MAG TPA: gamma carbonic anhydrase family protein [Methanobacteriaceae archaeon]|nr:gamma carbonic anhydrase family protein [Methanobacteriaceae archaeon]
MKTIHHTVKIMPGVHMVGRVEIGEKSSLWYNAVVRGDIEPITIGKYSNIQDNCVVHSSHGYPLTLGDYVSVGHAAVLHGCQVEDNCLIGMNATILNGSKIGKNSIIGAGAVVTEGKEFPPRSLILGLPARIVGKLDNDKIENIRQNALRYAELSCIQEE